MDPASIVGLVSACSNLVKTCGGVVETLYTLVETYKDAELSILSIIEECETVRFAWSRLEEWAESSARHIDSYEELLRRLQRSIYTGQLIMAALEEDLNNTIPKTGTFRRRAGLIWNEAIFQAHQSRIRGQVSALQLLVQVINM